MGLANTLLPILVPFLILYLSYRIKFIAYIISIAAGAGISVIYIFRDELPAKQFESLVGLADFKSLWIVLSVLTFIWIMYTGSTWAQRDEEKGGYFEIWGLGDMSKVSVTGMLALVGAIVSAVVGGVVSWLTFGIWEGFVYVLSAIEVIISILSIILFR